MSMSAAIARAEGRTSKSKAELIVERRAPCDALCGQCSNAFVSLKKFLQSTGATGHSEIPGVLASPGTESKESD